MEKRKKPKSYIGYANAIIRVIVILICILIVFFLLKSCSISYKLEGGSINYDVTKTIHISEFPNRTAFYPSLTQIFDQALRKRFVEQTRLKDVSNNADLTIEGEITGFDIAGQAVKEDAYASQTRLTISVKLRYINNKEAGKDIEQTFSSFKEFSSTTSLESVQEELSRQICDELVDMIYNATVANW
jgi:hypothetical protein